MTLTLDYGIPSCITHRPLRRTYTSNFVQIRKTFVDVGYGQTGKETGFIGTTGRVGIITRMVWLPSDERVSMINLVPLTQHRSVTGGRNWYNNATVYMASHTDVR